MRVPVSWLREFVDVPADATAEQILADLVRVGFEEEDVHGFELSGPIVVGKVVEFVDEPQSNGKTIRWCQVDVGEAEPRGIVCGAHNFFEGDKVVVTLPGSVLPGPFPIAARKTYGHVSDGMIASTKELGLGEDHEGILRLATLGLDPELGTDAIGLLSLDDFAVEINVTPDRGYAFSVRGVAREYSNSTGAPFRDPIDAVPSIGASGYPVVVDDQNPVRGRLGVSAFTARVVRDVDVTRTTPPWMASRLTLAGIRSISLIVDITNYVMIELGQPIHAYDLDLVQRGLILRRANPGEKLKTLDDRVRELHPEDMVVADDSGPIGLAGVMGGATTEIHAGSTNVLVEAGIWDPTSIARTARRHKLPSEAARRYERGVDPAVSLAGANRVVQLLEQLGGGTVDDLGFALPLPDPAPPIALPGDYIQGLIGVEYSTPEIVASLAAIGAAAEPSAGGWSVTVPTWRPDLTDAATLAEEVARIVGYDRIPSVLPVAPPGRGLTREQKLRRSAAQALAAGGLTEVLAYPFISTASQELVAPGQPSMKLANPLDAEAPFLRRSLLPGLLDIARRNLSRGLADLALFEIGTVFLPEEGRSYGSGPLPTGDARPGDATLTSLYESVPPQPWFAAALFAGDAIAKQPGQPPVAAGLADALAAAHQLGASVGVQLRVEQGSHPALHPGRTARILSGETELGIAGELLPSIARELDLPGTVALVELDLDAVITLADRDIAATPIATLPAATQDLSLVVAADLPAGQVLESVREGAGPLLEHIALVDDYRGTGIPAGSKSLTFALRFRAPDRTLTAEQATEAKLAGLALAATRHGATLRE